MVGGVRLSGVRKAQLGARARGSESAAWVASEQSGAVEELRRRGCARLVGQQGQRASRWMRSEGELRSGRDASSVGVEGRRMR
jgi:hypothetical protein